MTRQTTVTMADPQRVGSIRASTAASGGRQTIVTR
jgi:hypothetical protein